MVLGAADGFGAKCWLLRAAAADLLTKRASGKLESSRDTCRTSRPSPSHTRVFLGGNPGDRRSMGADSSFSTWVSLLLFIERDEQGVVCADLVTVFFSSLSSLRGGDILVSFNDMAGISRPSSSHIR